MSRDNQFNSPPPDIVMPKSMMYQLAARPYIVMILPSESKEGWFADYEKIVKFGCVSDQEYDDFFEEREIKQLHGHMFYDVRQIRQCRLQDVLQKEWWYNFGPPTPQAWAEHYEQPLRSIVRVYHLSRVSYDLASFNQSYRWGLL